MAIPYKLARTRNGKIRVKYRCPKCQSALESEITEAGNQDQCPDCGEQFTVPAKSKRDQLEQQLRQQQAEAKREAEEAAKRSEADRLAQEAQRRQAEQVAVATLEQSESNHQPIPDVSDLAEELPEESPQWDGASPWAAPPERPAATPYSHPKQPPFEKPQYPALELYRSLLRGLGWFFLAMIGLGWIGTVGLTIIRGQIEELPNVIVGTPIVLGLVFGPLALAAFVVSELLGLAIDARTDLARIAQRRD